MWCFNVVLYNIIRSMGSNCFYGGKECRNYNCSKYICSDSRASMASNTSWIGHPKCKSRHERFVGTFESFSSCQCY
nr:uncharacterized protein LOC109163805 isoform X2 [Ipomoea batatas]